MQLLSSRKVQLSLQCLPQTGRVSECPVEKGTFQLEVEGGRGSEEDNSGIFQHGDRVGRGLEQREHGNRRTSLWLECNVRVGREGGSPQASQGDGDNYKQGHDPSRSAFQKDRSGPARDTCIRGRRPGRQDQSGWGLSS